MKLSTLVPLIVAAGCAAAAIYLGSELSATRERLAQVEQARAADASRIHALEAANQQFESVSSAAANDTLVSSVAPAPPPREETPPQMRSTPATAAPLTRRRDPQDETPAAQNMRRIQAEVRLRRIYTDLPAALGLDAAQADSLFNLMANNQVSTRDKARSFEGNREELRAVEEAADRQLDAAILDLLGPQKAAQFQSFEKSLPARMQVGRIGETMEAANVPLSEGQRQSLIAAVISERDSLPPPERPDNSGPDDAEYRAKYLDWQADYSQRVQARIEPLLTAAQVAQYREAVEVQNARRAEARARAERSRQQVTR